MGDLKAAEEMSSLDPSSFSDHNGHVVSTEAPTSVASDSPRDSINGEQSQDLDYTENALVHGDSPISPQSTIVYVAPRIVMNHQDSFTEDTKTLGSPGKEDSRSRETPELGLPRLRVAGSQRAFVYHPRTVGSSPRAFGSPRAVGSPMGTRTPKGVVGLIDTAAPFESVKDAVSKFGGITDWKAHKMQAVERRELVEQELDKLQDEIPESKKQYEAAEEAKLQVLKELESTKRHIEELKLNLEKAQTEELQARQDSELAKLRVEEMEQGIADEASVAAKVQLQVAKARYLSAVSELKSVKEELQVIHMEYDVLMNEKDLAVKKAEEAVMESKEVERKMEVLTIELMATKELLESAHTAHLEAEEKRFSAAMARDQDIYHWEKELKIVEDDIERVNQEIHSANDVKVKLDTASALLIDLKAELAAYMEHSKSREGNLNNDFSMEKRSHSDIQVAVASAKKELEEVKLNIEKANAEVDSLKKVAASLQSQLEREKSGLAEITQREEIALVTVSSLESELKQTNSEIALVQTMEKEARDEMMEIPKKLQQAAKEADEAKLLAEMAHKELRNAKEEAEQVKAGVSTIESRLVAAKKEMEAARASEKLALAAIKALQESESAQRTEDVNSLRSMVISLEEYYELSKRAHEAEEEANLRVVEAVSKVELAKENESRSLERLEEVNREMSVRKEELKMAMEKAEKAREGKLGVEQELRKWRAEHGQRRKAGPDHPKSPRGSVEGRNGTHGFDPSKDASAIGLYTQRPVGNNEHGAGNIGANNNETPEIKTGKKKKKLSLLPKVLMFLSRKKSSHK